MPPSHWLVKSEPSAYSWDRFVDEKGTFWSGVRNPQARNNLAAMREGDLVLYYHSGEGREVVGVARVARESYPDPTSDDARWRVVDLVPLKPLRTHVPLAAIKADPALRGMALVRQSRLSVMPVSAREFERILELGRTKLARR